MNKIGDTLIHTGANKELVLAFVANGVEFVIIGGLAVSWYCADRKADDMDILVNPTPENSARISQALDGLYMNGYTSDSFTKPGLQAPLKQLYYAELLTPQKDGPTYSEVAKDAVEAKLFNIPVRLASVVSLIRLKEQAVASAEAQKDKHLKDIERLKKHAV
jgi:hypothetical protein